MVWLVYTRVSRVGDRGERLISPELQQSSVKAYAKGRGLDLELLEPELDVSGGTVERPVLSEAIARVERGEAAGIIVSDLDRLSRMDLMDALPVIRRIEEAGGQVIAVAQNFDASTPEGNMARNVFLSFNQMRLDQYGRHFRTVKRRAVEQGIWPVWRVPRGYVRGEDRRLVPSEDAELVRRAFELRAGGASWPSVGELLDCGSTTAAKIVRNRVYLGEVRLMVGGELVVNAEAHEPVVDRALFEAAQISAPRDPRGTHGPALLAGIVRCAGCRRSMSRDRSGHNNAYRCATRRTGGGTCKSPAWISAHVIEPYVKRGVLAHLEQITGEAFQAADGVGAAREQLDLAEAELAAFQRATSAAGVSAEHFAEGLRTRVADVEAARVALGRARGSNVASIVATAADEWPGLSVEDRRHVLRGSLGVVWVWRGRTSVESRVRLVAAGFEPADLPRPGPSGPYDLVPVDFDADLDGEIRVPPAEDVGESSSGAGA